MTVQYENGKPGRVIAANVEFGDATTENYVRHLRYTESDGKCEVKVMPNTRVYTRNHQIQTITETAARRATPIEIEYDGDRITRAKVNVG